MQRRTFDAGIAVAVSIVFVCLVVAGCKKGSPKGPAVPLESVVTNRMNDAAYLDRLKKNRAEQTQVAAARAKVTAGIDACKARVKEALPADADEAAFQAALEKDQAWQALVKQVEELNEQDRQTVLSAREAIRTRMEEESRAIKAVAEGKAKAVD
jgi:hypothetical protein